MCGVGGMKTLKFFVTFNGNPICLFDRCVSMKYENIFVTLVGTFEGEFTRPMTEVYFGIFP